MTPQLRSFWRCTNRDCERSSPPESREEVKQIPVCQCGALMHREESPPASTYLDFLRGEPLPVSETAQESES